ncbi:hypothetical protein V8C26DRAFT_152623 [Trichoderma gracile]
MFAGILQHRIAKAHLVAKHWIVVFIVPALESIWPCTLRPGCYFCAEPAAVLSCVSRLRPPSSFVFVHLLCRPFFLLGLSHSCLSHLSPKLTLQPSISRSHRSFVLPLRPYSVLALYLSFFPPHISPPANDPSIDPSTQLPKGFRLLLSSPQKRTSRRFLCPVTSPVPLPEALHPPSSSSCCAAASGTRRTSIHLGFGLPPKCESNTTSARPPELGVIGPVARYLARTPRSSLACSASTHPSPPGPSCC